MTQIEASADEEVECILRFQENESIFSSEFNWDNTKDLKDLNIGKTHLTSLGTVYMDWYQKQMVRANDFMGKSYRIEHTLPYVKWELKEEYKEIFNHKCQLAESLTKEDKKIKAWFALDLPQNIGPDIYGGLPGIILELDLNEGFYHYTAQSIAPISYFDFELPKEGELINDKEYTRLLMNFRIDKALQLIALKSQKKLLFFTHNHGIYYEFNTDFHCCAVFINIKNFTMYTS